MDWDVFFDGISIKDKIGSVKLTKQRDSFCREVDIELIDTSLYGQINWAQIPSAPRLEIRIDGGSGWASQGHFFIERPTYNVTVNERGLKGIWGRSSVAVLAEPFAKTVTKTWTQSTSLYAIIDEVLSGTGVALSRAKTTIPDFQIDSLAYAADKKLPIDIIEELAELCGGIVLSDASGNIFLQPVNYTPSTEDIILTDIDIEEYSEEIIFPEFANRVRILADESSTGVDIEILASTQCVLTGGTTSVPIYARVSDDEGNGINNVPVKWTVKDGLISLGSGATTNTGTVTVSNEEQTSDGFYKVDVKFPPKAVVSAYWAKDTQKSTNLAADGYTLDGNTIIFNTKLAYCDESLLVTYTCEGVASNSFVSGSVYGEDQITASIAGASATEDVYIGNPCKCSSYSDSEDSDDLQPKLGITITALPEKICAGTEMDSVIDPFYCPCPDPGCIASILVTAEDYGPIADGRLVTMKETTDGDALGELEWFTKALGNVKAEEVEGTIVTAPDRGNVIATTGHYWVSKPSKVEWYDEEGSTWTTISSIYINVDGKSITWNQNHFNPYVVGTKVRVTGKIKSAVINQFAGLKAGTATIEASVQFLKEDPETADCSVEIEAIGSSGGGGDGSNSDWVNKNESTITTETDSSKNGHTWSTNNIVKCAQSDGSTVTCLKGYTCCQKDGKYGCNKADECQGKEADEGCESSGCQKSPTDECMGTRFSSNNQTALKGCTCSKLCDKEFTKYGTTQEFDNKSYRTIDQIVTEDFGFVKNDGNGMYETKYYELKDQAIATCREKCGDCAGADPIQVSGTTSTLKNSSVQYGVSGGMGPYSWGASGSGASIDNSGLLTLTEACGTVTVTVTDKCGASSSISVRIIDNGQWVSGDVLCEEGVYAIDGSEQLIVGAIKYAIYWQIGGSGLISACCGQIPTPLFAAACAQAQGSGGMTGIAGRGGTAIWEC